MGFSKEPSVVTKDFAYLLACCEVAEKFGQPIRLNFHLRLTETTSAVWETVFWHKRLYVAFENSCGSIPQASKEAFVSLLEFAEDQLACTHVIVCLRKNSSLRASMMKTFMYLGFVVLPPTHELCPPMTDRVYMLYTFE